MYNNNANQGGRSSQYSGGGNFQNLNDSYQNRPRSSQPSDSRNNNNNYNNNNNRYNNTPPLPRAMTLPENYVDEAERVMHDIIEAKDSITTSKIRRIYNLICEIYNTENLRSDEPLAPESKTALNMARVRIAYEAGRDGKVKDFTDKTHIIEYIKGINSRENFINFARYMEALIAYHKFYGGKEN